MELPALKLGANNQLMIEMDHLKFDGVRSVGRGAYIWLSQASIKKNWFV